MPFDFSGLISHFFANFKPKNVKYASLFTLFSVLLISSLLLISLDFKVPSFKFNKWVAQENSESLYSCTPSILNLYIKCELNSTQLLYTIRISRTEDKAILSISQPEDYTMHEGIFAYKGYEYSDGNIMIKINEVGQARGVDISIFPLTKVPLYILILISLIGMIIVYYKNKNLPTQNPPVD